MKASVEDLAVCGGLPEFERELHVGRPNVGNIERFMERVAGLMQRRWLTNDGPLVVEFEQKVAALAGTKHCIAMCNATVALEIAIRALGLSGEVIIPSFTFIATAHALQWQQITPVFCDIDPRTHNIDPAQVESLITPRTTGIIGVHLWGRPCNTDALAEIARRRGLKLLFDAAHAFACSSRGTMVGSFGSAEVFSFHATKFLNTFEGGAVVTNDDDLNHRIRLMKNFGFSGYDNVTYIGTNGKMNEVSAAMGLTGLESLNAFIETNRDHYHLYRNDLSGLPGVNVLRYDESERCNYQYVVLEVDPEQCPIHRNTLLRVLHAERVLARRYFYPGCHRMEPYRTFSSNAAGKLPQTDRLGDRVLVLPTGTGVTAAEVARICQIIRIAIKGSPTLNQRLSAPPTPGGGAGGTAA